MPEVETSDEADWVPTECTYAVTMDAQLAVTYHYDPMNYHFEFTCPSEKLAKNFDTFLAQCDFLNVTFERGEAEGIPILARYLHPVNAWIGLEGIIPRGFSPEEAQGDVLVVAPLTAWGSEQYAHFVRSQTGILATEDPHGVSIEIGEPNVWVNAQFLFSAFDWFEDGEILPRIKQYLYPLSYSLFVEQNL
jgi:hypothetical protein